MEELEKSGDVGLNLRKRALQTRGSRHDQQLDGGEFLEWDKRGAQRFAATAPHAISGRSELAQLG